MSTFGYIILLVAMMIITLVRKDNMASMRRLIDPLFGAGLLFVGTGNFVSGEMIGHTARDMLFSDQTRQELWTLAEEPVQFMLVNLFFLFAGAGLILWRWLQSRKQGG